MNVLKMCLDRRVLAGLALIAIAIWVLAPQYVLAALPLLLFAACPLSMVVMAWMMRGHQASPTAVSADPQARIAELEHERSRLGDEIARARAQVTAEGVSDRS